MEKEVFNFKEAMERIGDEELIFELLEDIVELADATEEQLKVAIETNNMTEVRIAGHTLKGTAANLALPQLSEVGKAFDTAARNNDSSNLEELFKDLQQAVINFKQFLADR